ncbi:hypothetical protein [Pedobacter insulae]|uniref:Uncharacterized protein n=1 Tax=Pedobacter insulae TaxID=414048 RepID=A0A1I3AN21_9SPHI|nr:hypothetical protein [Pedobacter insulae]SFH51528.1 hypothetical protein SAMN04489864_11712 [Pedobacter insulae]
MEINNFGPFDSDIWGTVADWVIACVTLGTGIFLVLTFKEQQKTNLFTRVQMKRQILPKFIIQHKNGHNELSLTNAPAIEINIESVKDGIFENGFYEHLENFEVHHHPIVLPVLNEALIFDNGREDIINISFSDMEGSRYSQTIYYEHGEFFISIPKAK